MASHSWDCRAGGDLSGLLLGLVQETYTDARGEDSVMWHCCGNDTHLWPTHVKGISTKDSVTETN